MFKYYHIDRSNTLTTGEIIQPENFIFGKGYRDKFRGMGLDPRNDGDVKKAIILSEEARREFYLEYVRIHNPYLTGMTLPSRLDSFFAVETIEAANQLAKTRIKAGDNYSLYEIYTEDEPLALDMNWLDQQFPEDIDSRLYYYHQYWIGSKMKDDKELNTHEKRKTLTELLITKPVKIGDLVRRE
ncbi:hypothetical protein [Proteus mirabilis]|uniref:hypothetical protein n=1 Tax=Proteus mirabilis TaxID=584 RepID=UPI00331550AF